MKRIQGIVPPVAGLAAVLLLASAGAKPWDKAMNAEPQEPASTGSRQGARASHQKEASAGEPLRISGIYPHLAMFNDVEITGETGIGAVAPWAGRLWAVTYSAHKPGGSGDRLYEVDGALTMRVRPESAGGTPASRMVHRESGQLVIGPYLIDNMGRVRTIPPERIFGRLTAAARHLTDPANKVYFFTMEEGLYEVDVRTLGVKTLFEDRNGPGVPDLIPGYHGKGAYTGQGRLVVSNNGEPDWSRAARGPAGCLAEWDGEQWAVVERRQFTEVTGPGGIFGARNDADPVWATGWDERSVILMLLDEGAWHTFRLPKASHTYDGRHGWHTEWPRIREIGKARMLMTMHGMLWDFPKGFCERATEGIRPLSSCLKIVADFCEWKGRIVFACDDTSTFSNPLAGRSQSNLWFMEPDRLDALGPPAGFGGVWLADPVEAGKPSDPFLFDGFEHRVVHLWHDGDEAVTFTLETDRQGKGKWEAWESVTIPAKGYGYRLFPHDLEAPWIRVRTDRDCSRASAYFHYSAADPRALSGSDSIFAGIPRASSKEPFSFGLIRPRGGQHRTLHFAAWTTGGTDSRKEGGPVDKENAVEEAGYYEIDGSMELIKVEDPAAHAWLKDKAKIAGPDFLVDEASVILADRAGNRYRLPKGDPAFDQPHAGTWPRGIREVVTERSLLNCHGTFYVLPRESSGGVARIRPVCTHNRFIMDFCSWRGLLVLAGNRMDAREDGHYFASDDGKAGLWFGAVDDLWRLGKPRGEGGPWHETDVQAGRPSDPYLMAGYDEKTVDLSHDSAAPVTFTLEVDPTGSGDWQVYDRIAVDPGETARHHFPPGYSACWIRLKTHRDCIATGVFIYK